MSSSVTSTQTEQFSFARIAQFRIDIHRESPVRIVRSITTVAFLQVFGAFWCS